MSFAEESTHEKSTSEESARPSQAGLSPSAAAPEQQAAPAQQPPGFSTSAPVHPLVAARWSPRNIDPIATVTESELRSLLEAARWAPSCGGTAPARYIAGLRGSSTYSQLAGLLVDGNRYAAHAGALILGLSADQNEKGPLPYSSFDLGWATGQLALQAVSLGLVAHPMAGFDTEAALEVFKVPPGHRAWVMLAVGHLADPNQTADPRDPDLVSRAKERDTRPRTRPAFEKTIFGGTWGTPLS